MRHRGAHRGYNTGHVHGEQPLERHTVGGDVVDRRAGEHAGIIDQDIETAELLRDRIDEGFDLLGVGLIGFLARTPSSRKSLATASALSAEAA